MKRLFIEMYFDEDVSHIAARSLRNRGYRVLTTQETAQKRATDADQLAYAASQNLTLVATIESILKGSRRNTSLKD